MRTSINKGVFWIIALLLLSLAVPDKAAAQPGYNVSPQTFYDELDPYGQWVPNPTYGRVWIPDVDPGFQPYATNGHWAITEYGNTWVSDYDWGWAPFHYGRWFFDDYYGSWVWVPDNEWGPAWVSWRSGGGYYGWAPLGPGMNINVNINLPYNYWVFVPQGYITSPRVYNYCVPRSRVNNVYYNTTIINNVYQYNNRSYAYGPRRDEIERYTRRNVPVYRADDLGRRGPGFENRGSYGRNDRPDVVRNGNGNGWNRPNRDRFDNNNRNDNNRPEYNRLPDNRRGGFNDRNNPFENRNSAPGTPGNSPFDNDRPSNNRGDNMPADRANSRNRNPFGSGMNTPPNADAPAPDRSGNGSRGGFPQERRFDNEGSRSMPQFEGRPRGGSNDGSFSRPQMNREPAPQRSMDMPQRSMDVPQRSMDTPQRPQFQERSQPQQPMERQNSSGGPGRRGPL